MGHRGNPGHPQVQAAIEDAIVRIVKAGKAAGMLSADENLARRYIEMGATFVAVGVDTTVLMQGAAKPGREVQRRTGGCQYRWCLLKSMWELACLLPQLTGGGSVTRSAMFFEVINNPNKVWNFSSPN